MKEQSMPTKEQVKKPGEIEWYAPGFLSRKSYEEWCRYIEEKSNIRPTGRIISEGDKNTTGKEE